MAAPTKTPAKKPVTQSKPAANALATRKEESKEVIPYQLPDYLQVRQGGPRGGEEVEQRDVVQPRLAICQSNSPQRKRSSAKYIEGLEEGHYFNTLGIPYGPSVLVIPVFFFTSQIRFKDFDEGGGILCQAQDGKHGIGDPGGTCMRCELGPILGWHDEGGKRIPPECTEFKNYACVVIPENRMPAIEDVAIFSIKKTGMKQSKDWASRLRIANMDWWARIWQLDTVELSNENNQLWFSPTIKLYDGPRVPSSNPNDKLPSYFVNQTVWQIGNESYKAVLELRKAGQLKVDVEDLMPENPDAEPANEKAPF